MPMRRTQALMYLDALERADRAYREIRRYLRREFVLGYIDLPTLYATRERYAEAYAKRIVQIGRNYEGSKYVSINDTIREG